MRALLFFALVTGPYSARALPSCAEALNPGQERTINQLRWEGAIVRIFTKFVYGRSRTIVLAAMPTASFMALPELRRNVNTEFDRKGIVRTRPSLAITALIAAKRFAADFGHRLFARRGLAQLRHQVVGGRFKTALTFDPAELRKILIEKFVWEYALKSSVTQDELELELNHLIRADREKILMIGQASARVPAIDLLRALEPQMITRERTRLGDAKPREMRDLDLGNGRGLSFSFVFVREVELNRAVLTTLDERLTSSLAKTYFVLTHPQRATRLAATILGSGYRELGLDGPGFTQDNDPSRIYSAQVLTETRR